MRRSLSEFCVDVSIKEVLIKHKVNIALLLTLKPAAFNDDVLNMLRIRNRGEELLTGILDTYWNLWRTQSEKCVQNNVFTTKINYLKCQM